MAIDTEDVEEGGILTFRQLLRPIWIPHEESKDKGIDYRVELREDGRASGRFFFVQLKAQHVSKPVQKGKHIAFDLDIVRLKQYCKMHSPVFLVIADLSLSRCHYVFVQEYADLMKDQTWREKSLGTVAVRVPVANLVSATALIEEVKRASRYISSKLIQDGISFEEEFYESLDARHNVRLVASSTHKNFEVRAKEPVSVRCIFHKDKLPLGALDHFQSGRPMVLTPGSVTIEGSSLWEYIAAKACENGGSLTMLYKLEGHLSLSRVDWSGRVKANIDYLPCHIEGGEKEWRYRASSVFNVVNVRGEIRPTGSPFGPSHFNFHFSAFGWINKKLLALPLFDEIDAFLFDQEPEDRFRLEFFLEGIAPFTVEMDAPPEFDIGSVKSLLDILKTTRSIARYFNINPSLAEQFDDDFQESMTFLDLIMKGDDIPARCNFEKMNCLVSLDQAKSMIQDERNGSIMDITIVDSVFEKTIYGEIITVEGWCHVFQNLRLVTNNDQLQESIAKALDSMRIEFEPTDTTTVIITPASKFALPAP